MRILRLFFLIHSVVNCIKLEVIDLHVQCTYKGCINILRNTVLLPLQEHELQMPLRQGRAKRTIGTFSPLRIQLFPTPILPTNFNLVNVIININ